ncbi:MAG: hypothetical protein JWN57_2367, partial [Frankiales bacterium]|nr:hypothetical protein [Frankiales bacterium]
SSDLYFTDLPVLLVGLHLAGACVTLIASVRVVLAVRDRGPLAAQVLAVPAQARAAQPV